MKVSVEFPSVSYREGPEGVAKLARAIESLGYDQIDVFDHVIMGYETPTRPAPRYPTKMPVLEAMTVLSFIAANTSKIGLGTEVLVLPQRQPVLVAKQVSTLDTLSGGRMRLGVGVGWQESEYEMLEESFKNRGIRMDEAIQILRSCWSDDEISYEHAHYSSDMMAMEPKPPQGATLPIWVGGTSDRALQRVGELGDGWLAMPMTDKNVAESAVATIKAHAESAGRDPSKLGFQMMLDEPPRDAAGKAFYQDMDRVKERVEIVEEIGFDWGSINATAIFQAGWRSIDSIIDKLGEVRDSIA